MNKLSKAMAFVGGFAVLAAAGVVLAAQAGAATIAPNDPRRLSHVGDAQQLIVVTGDSITSTYATARTWQKDATGHWQPVSGYLPARLGWAGWSEAATRVQGSGTTPIGTFTITSAFGLKPNPGTKLPYQPADSKSYWAGDNRDAKTYNVFEPAYIAGKSTWRTSESEKISSYPTQYEAAAVIDFNRPAASAMTWNAALGEWVTSKPTNTKIGSGIFLHINGAGDTAGCVSLARSDLLSVLTWLDPAKKPRIVMAPLTFMFRA